MKKNKKTILIVGIAALVLVAGVLAYFSKIMSIDNPFTTKEYGGETVEKFTPEGDWEPGEQVTKVVKVDNTGDYDLWVRVKFEEKWERKSQTIAGTNIDSANAGFFPASADASLTSGSSVYKELLNTADWTKGSDGWFYYKNTLAPNGSTSPLLGSVTLCKDANMGDYTEKMLYAQVAKGTEPSENDWKETKPSTVAGTDIYQKKVVELDSKNPGLAGANYTLTITTEIAQADPAAVSDWKTYPGKQ